MWGKTPPSYKESRKPPLSPSPAYGAGKGHPPPTPTPFKTRKPTPQHAQEAIDYGSLEADQGTKWTDGKGIYRKTIGVGALANTGSTTTAHTISKLGKVLRVYGYATDATNYYSLPYASPTAVDNIAVAIDATNITITTGKDRTGNTGYITLEYTKS